MGQLGLEGRTEELVGPVDVTLPEVLPTHTKWFLLLVEESLLNGSLPGPNYIGL